ncbi:MAG: ATP-binding protein [Nostocaceae cyanobacterium]|nr:ATP-binding protein [Nostocaceae cyanobacterium]
MIPKNINDITETDLEILVNNSVPEGRTIEYKQELPGNSDKDKKEFLNDVSSFANASGGDLIYGIKEDKGIPISIEGLTLDDMDKERLRLDSIIRDGIKPRIPGVLIHPVRLLNSQLVLIIRVPKSWISPHRVVFKGHDKFYSRSSNGKYSLDVDELRTAFILSDSITEKIKKFRESRISNIAADETPVTLYPEKAPIIILHLISINSFNPAQNYDMNMIEDCSQNLKPILSTSLSSRYNLDGFVKYSSFVQNNETLGYIQVFRNGIIESVFKQIIRDDNQQIFYGDYIGEKLIEFFPKYLNTLKKLDVGHPIFIFLTIIGVQGFSMPRSQIDALLNKIHKIDRDVLILPEVLVESYDVVPSQILKPCFDAMWNAAGFRGSPNYNQQGVWNKRR